jgi:methyl-accepting chemotaxis protein
MAAAVKVVAQTVDEIAVFVTNIESIGSEIELIALNSQIKAALTGPEGAALGVLAEAIKRLSDEAVRQTSSVSDTLGSIHVATEHLMVNAENEEDQLDTRIAVMQDELAEILRTMADMNGEMLSVLSGLNDHVNSLTDDVEDATSRVDVHERTKIISDGVLSDLEQIVFQSRQIEPASSEFKENLRHMEEHYTMESERHIHEAIARKRGGLGMASAQASAKSSTVDDSEFGDNFDLF